MELPPQFSLWMRVVTGNFRGLDHLKFTYCIEKHWTQFVQSSTLVVRGNFRGLDHLNFTCCIQMHWTQFVQSSTIVVRGNFRGLDHLNFTYCIQHTGHSLYSQALLLQGLHTCIFCYRRSTNGVLGHFALWLSSCKQASQCYKCVQNT